MFKDFDSAIEELILWKEWHAAWIYRIRPARQMPRNYPLPDFLRVRQGDVPVPEQKPIQHLREPIDKDDDGIAPPRGCL